MPHDDIDEDWRRVQTEPRPATRDVVARGIGHLRMQLLVLPSFEEASAWEVRYQAAGWRLFSPRVFKGSAGVELLGYDAVDFPAEKLEDYFKRVVRLSFPLAPDLGGCAGADGTGYQFAVFGDLYSSWRFHWWSQSPKQWQPLVDIASEMHVAFSSAPR
jgi:hypothetical protein